MKQFKKMLKEFGGLPLLEANWKEDSFSWTNLFKTAVKYGHNLNDFFTILVNPDLSNGQGHKIYVRRENVLIWSPV